MTPDRLSKIRKLVDEGALGAGPVTTDLVRELLADRDRLAAHAEDGEIPDGWSSFDDVSPEDAAECVYGITDGTVHVWIDHDGVNIGSETAFAVGSAFVPLEAVTHVIRHVERLQNPR